MNDEQIEDDSAEEEGDGLDSEEMVYDSEEEAYEEKKYQERMAKQNAEAAEPKLIDTKDDKAVGEETLYDINEEVKKIQKLKPIDGVKFIEYDELGLPKDDGFDYYKYITTDTGTLDNVIEASPE